MENHYVLLRRAQASRSGSVTRSVSHFATETESLDTVLEAADLSAADVTDLHRDPNVLAACPNLPTYLIEPVQAADYAVDEATREALLLADTAAAPVALLDTEDSTWGIKAVGADQSPYSGKGVVVAVLDSGIDTTHERFKGMTLTTRNFTEDSAEDEKGHGTHCCGTLFGQSIAGKPRIGVAPNIERALVGKVVGDKGGNVLETAAGIEWAVQEGAHVVSMSLGTDFHSILERLLGNGMGIENALSIALDYHVETLQFYESVARYAQADHIGKLGTLLVAASGNSSKRFRRQGYKVPSAVPASAESILSVGALGRLQDMDSAVAEAAGDTSRRAVMTVAPFSNYNTAVSAPGYNIFSATPAGYDNKSGTSMAAPHVAGVAALWIEKQLTTQGSFNLDALKAQLQGNATTRGVLSQHADLGIGFADIGTGLVQAPD